MSHLLSSGYQQRLNRAVCQADRLLPPSAGVAYLLYPAVRTLQCTFNVRGTRDSKERNEGRGILKSVISGRCGGTDGCDEALRSDLNPGQQGQDAYAHQLNVFNDFTRQIDLNKDLSLSTDSLQNVCGCFWNCCLRCVYAI